MTCISYLVSRGFFPLCLIFCELDSQTPVWTPSVVPETRFGAISWQKCESKASCHGQGLAFWVRGWKCSWPHPSCHGPFIGCCFCNSSRPPRASAPFQFTYKGSYEAHFLFLFPRTSRSITAKSSSSMEPSIFPLLKFSSSSFLSSLLSSTGKSRKAKWKLSHTCWNVG